MKFATVALVAAAAVSAEVVYDAATGTFKCTGASVDKNFCAGTSLQTNIIIRCTGEKGQPGNCNNNLAGVPPVGVKTAATCYQSSETAGDAGCSFAGVVYPDSGEPYPVPGYEQPPPPPTYDTTTTTSSVYAPPTYSPPPPEYTTTSTSSVYVPPPYYPPVNTTTTHAPPPPPTYVPPTSYGPTTLTTVTGTTTVTTCSTTTSKYPEPPVPTTYVPPPPPHNTTSYTTSLPVPTYVPSGASNNVASGSLLLGAVAAIGFLFL